MEFTFLEDSIGKLPFSKETLENQLSYILKDKSHKIDVIFVDSDYIRSLNNEFRSVDEATDVLSFNSDGENESPSEVYISPDYIAKTLGGREVKRSQLLEEILRMVIHGVLHLIGHEHKGYFEYNSDEDSVESEREEMFVIQEDLLSKLLKKLQISLKSE